MKCPPPAMDRLRRPRGLVVSLLVPLLLAACGGGSGSPGIGAPVGTGLYVPFTAAAIPTSAGANGLFVVRTDALGGAPIQVSSDTVQPLAYVLSYALSAAGVASAGAPQTFVYATAGGAGGGGHLWALALSDAAAATPKQITSLSFAAGAPPYCRSASAYDDLSVASSAFVLLALAPPGTADCLGSTSADQWVLLHVTDGAAMVPQQVAAPSVNGQLQAIYHAGGPLAGFVTIDDNHDLVFYAGTAFANPKTLVSGVLSFSSLQPTLASRLGNVSTTPTFVFVQVNFLSGAVSLYRIDDAGSVSADLYDFHGGADDGIAADSAYFYFADTRANPADVTQSIERVPLDGHAPAQALFSAPSITAPYLLVGLLGGQLLLEAGSIDAGTGVVSTSLATLPAAAAAQPTTIATFQQPASAIIAGNDVAVTLSTPAASAMAPIAYSTQVIAADGSVVQPLTAKSAFLVFGVDPLLQVKNVTDAGYYGGGELFGLTVSPGAVPAVAPFTLPNAAPYALPGGTVEVFGLDYAPGLQAGGGSAPGGNFGIVFDAAHGILQPVVLPGTNVAIAWPIY